MGLLLAKKILEQEKIKWFAHDIFEVRQLFVEDLANFIQDVYDIFQIKQWKYSFGSSKKVPSFKTIRAVCTQPVSSKSFEDLLNSLM